VTKCHEFFSAGSKDESSGWPCRFRASRSKRLSFALLNRQTECGSTIEPKKSYKSIAGFGQTEIIFISENIEQQSTMTPCFPCHKIVA
jgi:hypothetical protein